MAVPPLCLHGALTTHLYLRLNGQDVKGESIETSLARKDSIEAVYYEQSLTADSAGAKAGSIMIRKRIDRSSPLLIKGLLHQEMAEGFFRFYRPNPTGDGTTEQFFMVAFKNGRIASIKQFMPDTINPATSSYPELEEVTLEVGWVEWTYTNGGVTANTDPAPPGTASPDNTTPTGTGSDANTAATGTGSADNTTTTGATAPSGSASIGATAPGSAPLAGAATQGNTGPGRVVSPNKITPLGGPAARAGGEATATQPADGALGAFGQWYYSGANKIALMVQSLDPAQTWSSGAALEENTSLMRAPVSFRNDASDAWRSINGLTLKLVLLDANGQTISGETHMTYVATGVTDGSLEILKGQQLNFVYDIAYRTGTRPAELVVRGFETSLRYRIAGG